jgi:hypothetical protein
MNSIDEFSGDRVKDTRQEKNRLNQFTYTFDLYA